MSYIYIYIYGAPILDVSRPHTTTQHSRQDSSGRVISSTQRPLPDNTQHSQQTNIHSPGRDSNPQSQQASGRKPTPQTARNGTGSYSNINCKYLNRLKSTLNSFRVKFSQISKTALLWGKTVQLSFFVLQKFTWTDRDQTRVSTVQNRRLPA